MFTVCPKCSLKLVVTAADLRAAQGYVRCGRCSNVFNALVGLTDEQQAVLAREDLATPNRALAPAAESPGAADHLGAAANPGAALDEASLEFDPATTDVAAIFVDPDADHGESGAASALGTTASVDRDPERSDPLEHAERHEPAELHEPTERADLDRTDLGLYAEVDQPAEPEERFDFDPRTDLDLDTGLDPDTKPDRPDRPEDVDPHADLEATDEFELADLEPLLTVGTTSPAASEAAPVAALTDEHDGAADATSGIGPSATASDESHTDRAANGDAGATVAIEPSAAGGAGPSDEPASTASAEVAADAVAADDAANPDAGTNDEGLAEADPAEVDALLAQAPEAPAPPRRGRHAVLQACSIVLALLLAAQLVNHYRVALAGVAILHAPLTRTYAALGRPITPRWNVKAYEVRQLGAVISPADPGALTVRASIENTAARRQPLPLLRVMVQDRFGNVVAARDVSPRAYLPPAAAGHRWLGAGQRVDAQVALADPGTSVVGFEIDACLADAAGRVACANGSSPVPGRAAR